MSKGLKAFTALGFSPRTIQMKSAAYTALLTDDQVTATTAITVTLPVISTMVGTVVGNKMLKLKAAAAYALTVTPGTGNTINGGMTGWVVPANQSIIIKAEQGDTDWEIVSPDMSQGIGDGRLRQTVIATTSGTTAVNVFSSAGAPAAFTVESLKVVSQDTTAANITLKNGTNTIGVVAKGTTAGLVTGEDTLSNTAVSKGAVFTVESSSAGVAFVEIGIVIN